MKDNLTNHFQHWLSLPPRAFHDMTSVLEQFLMMPFDNVYASGPIKV
jgi:hypothetical protein